MKNKIILLFILTITISCKTTTKVESTPRFVLSDNWLLKTVGFQNPNTYDNVILFNDATNLCFKDSIWEFKSTNNSGSYSINDLNCSFGYRSIWFKFIKTDQKTGVTDIILRSENKSGLVKNHNIKVTKSSDIAMQWDYDININGKTYAINMQFEKI